MIDEFIYIGRRGWNVIIHDGDTIYDIEGHFHLFPSQTSYEISIDSNIWQQGDGIITDVFQAPKGDLVICSSDGFLSYLEDFDEYSFDKLDLFYEEDYQPPLCLDIDKGEDISCLK